MKRKKIGELLVEDNLITKERLEEALEIQKKEGGFLGKILVRLEYLSEEDIVGYLMEQHGCAYLPLANYEIDPELIKLIPKDLAKDYLVIPLDKIGDLLTIATANPLNLDIIDLIKEHTGLSVQIFLSTQTHKGEDALEEIKKSCPDIVFLDIKMPGMDGIDTLIEIRKISGSLPVIMITAYGTQRRLSEAKKHGISGFFPKGSKLTDMTTLIQTVLRKHKDQPV
jgi:CheY-like chemotaxis protein